MLGVMEERSHVLLQILPVETCSWGKHCLEVVQLQHFTEGKVCHSTQCFHNLFPSSSLLFSG